jgi:hypothetical protein
MQKGWFLFYILSVARTVFPSLNSLWHLAGGSQNQCSRSAEMGITVLLRWTPHMQYIFLLWWGVRHLSPTIYLNIQILCISHESK